ncbi:Reverse transcriptase zinc-binding domain, partial [Thalictrum thalictroides]
MEVWVEDGALWKNFILAKYGVETDGWWPKQVAHSHGCSIWKGILSMLPDFKVGIAFKIGDGARKSFNQTASVRDLCHPGDDTVPWHIEMRRNLRDWEVPVMLDLMDKLKNIQCNELEGDSWVWLKSKVDCFTVRSMYKFLLNKKFLIAGSRSIFPADVVWDNDLPTNIKFFFWTLLLDRTLTRQTLVRR